MTATVFNFIQTAICWAFGLIFICSVVSIIDREIRTHRARKAYKSMINEFNETINEFNETIRRDLEKIKLVNRNA
jgi:cbb3-type cytochrome oxidase subunit 3